MSDYHDNIMNIIKSHQESSHMSSVGMSNHGLSEMSIVILTIHDNARTVV